MWESPSSSESIMSHLSYCCDKVFRKLIFQFNWNKKEFYVKAFSFSCFAVDRSTYIQYKLKICCEWLSLSLGSYGRNNWGSVHPVRGSQSPTNLCLHEGNPDNYWNVCKPSWCSRGSWDVCCKLLSLQFCVCCAYHTALPHWMLQVSWCRLHPAEELGSVSSSCSGKAVSRQPELSEKTHCLHKLCVLKTLAERAGKFFKWAWPVGASLYKDYRKINFLITAFSWCALHKQTKLPECRKMKVIVSKHNKNALKGVV